jgi:hypothetical protein
VKREILVAASWLSSGLLRSRQFIGELPWWAAARLRDPTIAKTLSEVPAVRGGRGRLNAPSPPLGNSTTSLGTPDYTSALSDRSISYRTRHNDSRVNPTCFGVCLVSSNIRALTNAWSRRQVFETRLRFLHIGALAVQARYRQLPLTGPLHVSPRPGSHLLELVWHPQRCCST